MILRGQARCWRGSSLVLAKIRAWSQQLYAQSQKWGQSPTCVRDLFILSIISCTLIPVPVEALLIAIITASPRRWIRVVIATTLGSVIGALVCYSVGYLGHNHARNLLSYFSPTSNWNQIKHSINHDGMIFIAIASFTPGLFRIGMVVAGVMNYNPFLFVLGVMAGRLPRFFLEAGLLRLFGAKLRLFLEKYFDVVTLGMGAISIGFLIAIKFWH